MLVTPLGMVTLATLVHEMMHLYNLAKGIKDSIRGNTYHNRRFKLEAEKRGLRIEYDKRIGWSRTSPGPELIAFIAEKGWSKLKLRRDDVGGGGTSKGTSSSCKYACPGCGQSVRATKEVHLICGDCMERMVVMRA